MKKDEAIQVAAQLVSGVLASGQFQISAQQTGGTDVATGFAVQLFWEIHDKLLEVAGQRRDAASAFSGD